MGPQIVDSKLFIPFIGKDSIEKAVVRVANEIYMKKHWSENPIFLVVLNGSFMFASDLMKAYPGDCEIQFCRLKSYEGTQSTGDVKVLMDVSDSIEGRNVVIIEDIVESGRTLKKLLELVSSKNPKSIETCTLLYKPQLRKINITPDYVGFEIKDEFVVGYGLDYNELGRNLPEIYVEKNN